MRSLLLLISMTFLSTVGLDNHKGQQHKTPVKVACIGDSITYGARLDDRENHSYPAQLQNLLGKGYEVTNLGVGGCTLLRKGKPNVWDQLAIIRDANPDIVVIMLGTNDTCGLGACGERKCWEYKDEYASDYVDLIYYLHDLPSKPRIWLCAPTPMVLETPGLDSSRIADLSIRKPRLDELVVSVMNLAKTHNVGFIDLNTPLNLRPDLFTEKDGVHPNKAGYRLIAEMVYKEITR